jgi:hypothetical protein
MEAARQESEAPAEPARGEFWDVPELEDQREIYEFLDLVERARDESPEQGPHRRQLLERHERECLERLNAQLRAKLMRLEARLAEARRAKDRDAALRTMGVTVSSGQGRKGDPEALYELYGAILERVPVAGPGPYVHITEGRVAAVERPDVLLDRLADKYEARSRGEAYEVDRDDPLGLRAAGLRREVEYPRPPTPKVALEAVAELAEKSPRAAHKQLARVHHRRDSDGRPTYPLPPEPTS